MGSEKRRRLPPPASSPQWSTSDPAEELDRFTAERIREQLSTEPVDEEAAEDLLRRAYATAGLPAPGHIHWLDGPLELVAALAGEELGLCVDEQYRDRVPHCVWDDAQADRDEIQSLASAGRGVEHHIQTVHHRASDRVQSSVRLGGNLFDGGLWDRVRHPFLIAVGAQVTERIWQAVSHASGWPLSQQWSRDSTHGLSDYIRWLSIRAYDDASWLAALRFYDEYVARDEAGALARFNEFVSGYWLGQSLALLVRRPRLLSRDEQGRLHNATGPCVAYHDGWSFYAWHGVIVLEHVILSPEELTLHDFLNESNVEVRRVIMERMGDRFIREIGARFVSGGSRGVLYEIDLPGDPDRVARYVQVLDPSTSREYYLRVPPAIQTADEAVAWTFGLSAREYDPAQES